MQRMVEVEHLHKRFGNLHAVNDLSLTVERGEVLGFLGPNGAGKSTTMKMITGFLEPTSGAIRIAGQSITEQPIECKQRVGYLAEGAPSYGEMTPAQFLHFIAEVRGIDPGARKQRVSEVADKINLNTVMGQPIETLSKGYKRRVGLAQAIIHDPEILILDEPTDGLDPNQKHEVRSLIKEMAADKAIVVSTHILEEVDAVCTRAVIIARGKLLFDGTPDELATKSKYHQCVSMHVANDAVGSLTQDLNALESVAGVETFEITENESKVTAFPSLESQILIDIESLAHRSDYAIRGVTQERGKLDDVFRTITTGTNTR